MVKFPSSWSGSSCASSSPQHPVNVRLAGLERGKLVRQLRHNDVDYFIQVGQGVALGVREPVVGVALEDDALARLVAGDGERAGANDLGRVRFDVPDVVERLVVNVRLQDVLRVNGGPPLSEGTGQKARAARTGRCSRPAP